MYRDLASLYDILMVDVDYEAWYLHIEKIFKKFKKTPKSILEMACGTGNISYYLAKEDYELTSFDLSTDMLSLADSKLKDFKNAKLLKQDMVNFNMDKKYDSVLSICDGINYILDSSELLDVFKNVKNHLKDDGIFIFDISSYYKLKYILGYNTFIEDGDSIYYTWQNYFDSEKDIVEMYLDFFVEEDDGRYRRFEEVHFQKAHKIEEILTALEEVGFSEVQYFDSFSFNEPGNKSERIVFIALI